MYATYEREKITSSVREDIHTVFEEAYINGLEVTKNGKVANYIPALAHADPSAFGIAAMFPDGEMISFGDVDTRFSMQSVSKVVTLLASLKYKGFRETFSHVMMEPTGDAFNSIIKLDTRSDLPFNPMINAGAIQTTSLLVDTFSFEDLLQFARELCLDDEITLNEEIYNSEFETGDRNRAIVYLLSSKGVLQADPEKTLDMYFKMCSLNVTAKSLAGLGVVIATNGVNPLTGKHWVDPDYVRTLKSLMFTCGMYDFSGEYGVRVGVPSKSGVGGGVVCAAKLPLGIGFYGPSLDPSGNSTAAVHAMEHISHRLNLHTFG